VKDLLFVCDGQREEGEGWLDDMDGLVSSSLCWHVFICIHSIHFFHSISIPSTVCASDWSLILLRMRPYAPSFLLCSTRKMTDLANTSITSRPIMGCAKRTTPGPKALAGFTGGRDRLLLLGSLDAAEEEERKG